MTKKLVITYTFLFLFVFTFALSFTLASQAQAEINCCVYEWCYFYNPPTVGAFGHPVWIEDEWVCVFTGQHECDVAYECPGS